MVIPTRIVVTALLFLNSSFVNGFSGSGSYHGRTHHHHRSTSVRYRSDSSSEAEQLSRRDSILRVRQFLIAATTTTTSTFITTTTATSSIAHAAIPTIDDYESTTNGATIINSQRRSDKEEALIQKLSRSGPIDMYTKEQLLLFIETTLTSIIALDTLVLAADWSAVRSVLRSEGSYQGNALGMARKPYFGMAGGQKAFRKNAGSSMDVSIVENAREDLAFSLSQLEDFALENRSVFFNSVDRKEVDALIAETGYLEKLDEGKSLLKAVKSSAVDFQTMAQSL